MKKTPTLLPSLIFFFSMITGAKAVEYQSPRTLALGGAGRASPWLTDSIYLNPSFASFNPTYTLSGGYLTSEAGRNYNLSVEDSRNELLQAGVGYTKREADAAVNFGASRSFINKYAVGLGTKLIIEPGTNHTTVDAIASFSWLAMKWLHGSVVIDNLFEGDEQIKHHLYRTVYTAMKFEPARKIDLFFDPFYSPSYSGGNKAGYSTGVEIGMLDDLYFRVGKFQDADVSHLTTRGSGFGFGAGWLGPKLSLEYAVNRTLTAHSGAPRTTAHAGSATIYF